MVFGQFAATTQFYLYGRKHFTRTGWEAASRRYPRPDPLESFDLAGKTYVVTGANQGIGFEIAKYLASRGGRVFMVCRSAARAETARQAIVEQTQADCIIRTARPPDVQCLICDVGIEADVRGAWAEFAKRAGGPAAALDGIVCNAGALFNERTTTPAGLETTFASHLLFGSYLMIQLALPHLRRAADPRAVLVSSGGMLNSAFPPWEVATSTRGADYDGNLAYAYAKRGQVLLCERWTVEHPGVKFVSAHPGWTATAAVDNAYGEKKSYLEPMRSTWEGAEGIAWLAAAPGEELQSGEFYLDRSVQPKHIAGAFFSEGSFTKNTEVEVDLMCANLQSAANGRADEVVAAPAAAALPAQLPPQEAPIELPRFMGRWYVLACIPSYPEKGASNSVEDYVWEEAEQRVAITFSYTKPNGSAAEILQRGTISNEAKTKWAVCPKALGGYVPLNLGYTIAHCAPDYSTTIVGLPDRSNAWIMAREPAVPREKYVEELRRCQALGFDMSKVVRVRQDRVYKNGAEPEPEPEGAGL